MDLRYLRFLRAMVRWLLNVTVFAMFFAFFAFLAFFVFQKTASMLAKNDAEDSRPSRVQSPASRLTTYDSGLTIVSAS